MESGFLASGLYPWNEKAIDYTKCAPDQDDLPPRPPQLLPPMPRTTPRGSQAVSDGNINISVPASLIKPGQGLVATVSPDGQLTIKTTPAAATTAVVSKNR